jgi:NAD(P)-dependent dehydrogenase (short-subunit alcohol dehydrogenase family)
MIGGVAAPADAASTGGIAALLDTARRTFGPEHLRRQCRYRRPIRPRRRRSRLGTIIAINVRAHIRAAKAVVPEWLECASGHFAAVASAAGLLTQLGAAPYSVTKHAAVGFAEWLAISYGDNGIGVSCVCPMGVDTRVLRGMSNSSDAEFQVAAARPRQCGDRPRHRSRPVVQAIDTRTSAGHVTGPVVADSVELTAGDFLARPAGQRDGADRALRASSSPIRQSWMSWMSVETNATETGLIAERCARRLGVVRGATRAGRHETPLVHTRTDGSAFRAW